MGRNPTIYAGDKFGLLTVVNQAPSRGGQSRWECICECKNTTEVFGSHLRNGTIRSCGCARRKHQQLAIVTHGLTGSRTHTTWSMMKQRCLNKRSKDYHRYGGRGIMVCERWMSFDNFVADMGLRPEGLTLDRIKNDGDYEPNNCRWATVSDQQANRKKTIFITIGDKIKPLSVLAKEYGMKPKNVYMRLSYGWSPEEALGIIPRRRNPL